MDGFQHPDVGVGFERRFVFRSGESGREAVSGGWDDGHLRKFGFGAGTLDDEYLFVGKQPLCPQLCRYENNQKEKDAQPADAYHVLFIFSSLHPPPAVLSGWERGAGEESGALLALKNGANVTINEL